MRQLFAWLRDNASAPEPERITRADVTEYFAALDRRVMTGTTQAHKLAAVRKFFRFLEETEAIRRSPCLGVETPSKEQRLRMRTRDVMPPLTYAPIGTTAGLSNAAQSMRRSESRSRRCRASL